uniref:PABC domain-containing protein n=1 Tax=Meloidogyne hapla TaxID=6305 RepID=A0A1I8B1I4_MELHA
MQPLQNFRKPTNACYKSSGGCGIVAATSKQGRAEENERLKEKCGETDETNEDEEEEMDDEEEEEETVEEEEEMETSENKEDKDENAGNNNKNEEIQQINKDEQIKEKEETIKEQKQNEEINKDEQVKEKEETTKAPSNQAASRAVKKRRRKGKEAERENLRNQLLTANTQQERKQILEEKLCPLVSRYFRGKDAGKITGMILENENSEILKALENDELLRAKVSATVEMFQASRVAQQH